jgi:hypothetical protein
MLRYRTRPRGDGGDGLAFGGGGDMAPIAD